MGKAVCSGLIDTEAKAGIAAAAPLVVENESIAGLLEMVGKSLKKEVDELKAQHGENLPKLRLVVKIQPVKGGG